MAMRRFGGRTGLSGLLVLGAVIGAVLGGAAAAQRNAGSDRTSFVNSIDVRMVRIPAGVFQMGNERPTDHRVLGQSWFLTAGDYDETPVHEVRISSDFYLSEVEITVQQFLRFRQEYQDAGRYSPLVTGVSYEEAAAFCEWLSAREKRPYRLPTEAEWEYAARAGTTTHFSSGDSPPPPDAGPNAFGLKNMHAGPLEWVADWYGPYPEDAQVDPVGPATGWGRVVRGGGPQGPRGDRPHGLLPYFRRSANRASAPPDYRGMHTIGFRIALGEPSRSAPYAVPRPLPLELVKQKTRDMVEAGPPPDRPWFQRRPLLPIPPENMNPDAVKAAGLDPGLGGHNHSAGVTVAPNGDVLVVAFAAATQQAEYYPGNLFVVTRRRFGTEQWDFPAVFMDFADVMDASALLWTDGDRVHFFGGGVGLSEVPFRWTSSPDSGATWSPVRLPLFDPPLLGYSPQPISSAFRTSDGAMHIAIDGVGGESLLLASRDEGRTWFDVNPRGHTRGRHTVYAPLGDGRVFALGGKETDIDGYMPQFRSTDGGKTWTESKSPFPALGSHQRPTMIRLKSGRLFFASDWQDHTGKQPPGITERGAFVALSSDDGATWHTKTLKHARPHEAAVFPNRDPDHWARFYHDSPTLGYAAAAQGPDGVIHLITSMTHPSEELEMNEAWILSDADDVPTPAAAARGERVRVEERRPDGTLEGSWTGLRTEDGRFVLDGTETWFYPDGTKHYEATYRLGFKTGSERYWGPDGRLRWEWQHDPDPDGRSVWTQYWNNGRKKHRSEWRGVVCDGVAQAWTRAGAPDGEWQFADGDVVRR